MSFVRKGSTVISFATSDDVVQADQRIFDQNEGLTDDVIEASLIRATERILTKLKDTEWWKTQNAGASTLPNVNPILIINRQNDFTDLCIYEALAFYILPSVADFDNEQQSERNKMSYYQQKASNLFIELVQSGDFYDFDGDGRITANEIKGIRELRKRVR